MTKTTKPSKEDVRQLMRQSREARKPPMNPEDIKQQLGWALIEAELIEAQRREQRGK